MIGIKVTALTECVSLFQSGISHKKIPKTRMNSEFSGSFYLLPLNRCRGFVGNIKDHAADSGNFRTDAVGDRIDQIPRQAHPLRRHRIH